MARDRGDVAVAFQLPLYPMIDDRNATESARDNDAPVWNEKHNRLGWRLYLGDLAAATSRSTRPRRGRPTTPASADGHLRGRPRSLPRRDDRLRRGPACRRRAGGVPTLPACYHGFDGIGAETKVGREANAFVHEQFTHAVDTRFAPQTG